MTRTLVALALLAQGWTAPLLEAQLLLLVYPGQLRFVELPATAQGRSEVAASQAYVSGAAAVWVSASLGVSTLCLDSSTATGDLAAWWPVDLDNATWPCLKAPWGQSASVDQGQGDPRVAELVSQALGLGVEDVGLGVLPLGCSAPRSLGAGALVLSTLVAASLYTATCRDHRAARRQGPRGSGTRCLERLAGACVLVYPWALVAWLALCPGTWPVLDSALLRRAFVPTKAAWSLGTTALGYGSILWLRWPRCLARWPHKASLLRTVLVALRNCFSLRRLLPRIAIGGAEPPAPLDPQRPRTPSTLPTVAEAVRGSRERHRQDPCSPCCSRGDGTAPTGAACPLGQGAALLALVVFLGLLVPATVYVAHLYA